MGDDALHTVVIGLFSADLCMVNVKIYEYKKKYLKNFLVKIKNKNEVVLLE